MNGKRGAHSLSDEDAFGVYLRIDFSAEQSRIEINKQSNSAKVKSALKRNRFSVTEIRFRREQKRIGRCGGSH